MQHKQRTGGDSILRSTLLPRSISRPLFPIADFAFNDGPDIPDDPQFSQHRQQIEQSAILFIIILPLLDGNSVVDRPEEIPGIVVDEEHFAQIALDDLQILDPNGLPESPLYAVAMASMKATIRREKSAFFVEKVDDFIGVVLARGGEDGQVEPLGDDREEFLDVRPGVSADVQRLARNSV